MADIVLALKPTWLELILSGKKTAEFRRVLPQKLEPGDKVYLYCKKHIHGVAHVAAVKHVFDFEDKRNFIQLYSELGCLTHDDIWIYWTGAQYPGVILLNSVTRYDDPHPWRGSVPQNFIYYHEKVQTRSNP